MCVALQGTWKEVVPERLLGCFSSWESEDGAAFSIRKLEPGALVDSDRQHRDIGRGRPMKKWVDVLSCTCMLVASRLPAASSATPPGHHFICFNIY